MPSKAKMSSKLRNSVLVVEDDYASMQYLLLLLKKLNCKIYSAESGEAALELMKDKAVDIMLLDIALGAGITGLELGIKLKQKKIHDPTPMIAVTAFSEDKLKNMKAAGFSGYLPKPYTIKELKATLKKYIICPADLG